MATIQRAPLVPRLSPAPQQMSPLACFPGMIPRMLAGLKFNGLMPPMMPPSPNSGMYPGCPPSAAAQRHMGPLHPASAPVSHATSHHPMSTSHHHMATSHQHPMPTSHHQMPTPHSMPSKPIPVSPVPLPAAHPTGMPSGMPTGMSTMPQLEMHPRFLSPMPVLTFAFSQNDLDMMLYGYAKSPEGETKSGHALSGLRVGHLSHGIDRILGSSPTKIHTPKPPPPVPRIDPNSLDLPEGIELKQTIFAGALHHGIFCSKTVIPKGTKFGPFRGKQVNTSEIKTNDDNSHMWEIFEDGRLSHFVDGRGCSGNWMAYVNCARYAQEQNLIAVQDAEIFYEVCKDIHQGTELLVWYGESYLQFMGIPVALKNAGTPPATEEPEGSEGYQCERCGKVFAYRYYRDKHLKYTRCVDQGDRKFPCHLCTRSFEKRDRLRIHILHVHEKHRPHKCVVCAKSFSQSSSLNKHMRVHSGERPYKCVYCNKAFTASSILRTHIRQHSGEKPFKCKHCGKAFASHAAHDSHVRRTHARDRIACCPVCGENFPSTFDLRVHMAVHKGMTTGGVEVAREPSQLSHILEEPLDVVGLENDESSRVI